MIETQIPKKDVLRLFENNGFDFNEETHELVYEDERGVKRGFPLPWLKDDDTALYDLGSVRKLLGKMMATVKLSQTIMDAANDKAFMDDVAAALREFGMSYIEPENKDGQEDQGQVFVYDERVSCLSPRRSITSWLPRYTSVTSLKRSRSRTRPKRNLISYPLRT